MIGAGSCCSWLICEESVNIREAKREQHRPPTIDGVSRERECLRALRAELSASYPRIRSQRLIRIARKAGFAKFPAGFLIDGSLTGFGTSGALATLRAAQRTRSGETADLHPLFSQAHYLLTNPDVAGAGVAPWLHYQVYGRAEGRSPHPLVDTGFLSAWLADTPRQDVFDHYLADPALWVADPGPYIDCRKFMLYGNWDETTNPLLQIARSQISSHWVHRRLMLVDAASPVDEVARLTGIGFLLSKSSARARLATLRVWNHERPETGVNTFTVVPGYFLGAAGSAISAVTTHVVSPDSTFIALPTEHLSVEAGETIEAAQLAFFENEYDRDTLNAIVAELVPNAAVAPYSPQQQMALERLIDQQERTDLRVLAHGRQVRINSAVLRAMPPTNSTNVALLDATSPAHDVAIVVTEAHWPLNPLDPGISDLLARGATLCLIGAQGLEPWLPTLERRTRVACEPQWEAPLRSLLDPSTVYSLGAS
jgi:hypothetical protein